MSFIVHLVRVNPDLEIHPIGILQKGMKLLIVMHLIALFFLMHNPG
jgi:hypothetical protein